MKAIPTRDLRPGQLVAVAADGTGCPYSARDVQANPSGYRWLTFRGWHETGDPDFGGVAGPGLTGFTVVVQ